MSALTQETYGRLFLIAIVAAIVGAFMFLALSPAGAAIVDPHKKTGVYGDACDALGFDTKSFSFTIPHGDDDDNDDSRVFDRTFSLEDGASLFVSVASNRKTMSFGLADATADGVVMFTSYSQGTANVYDYRGVEPPVTSDDDVKAYKGRSIKKVTLCYTTKASPTIAVSATASVEVGTAISATAALAGSDAATQTVSISLYSDAACTSLEAGPVEHEATGDGSYSFESVTPNAGTYYWRATYEGDENNNPADSGCGVGSEVSEIDKATPTISTMTNSDVVVGSPISASAMLNGGYDLGGVVTFKVWDNDACSGEPLSVLGPIAVSAPGVWYPSGDFTPDSVGRYHWIAEFVGNSNNHDAASVCSDETQVGASEVVKASPTISTEAVTDVALGASISDTATLLGGYEVGGDVTFRLFDDDTCTDPAVASLGPIAVDGSGSAASGDHIPTEAGRYYWIASYSGDGNNNAVDGECGDANETSLVYASLIACGFGDSISGLEGDIASAASFQRGEESETGKDSCGLEIPYTFEIQPDYVGLEFPINVIYPGARFLVRIDWNPDDPENIIDPLNPPVREVDYFVNGDFVPGVPCSDTDAPLGAEPSVDYWYEHPADVPVCLAGYDIRLTADGTWQQIQWWDVIGDPRWV